MLCPKTEQQKLLLQLSLQASFIVSNVWNIPKLNLLLQVCEHFHPIDVNSKDLELMQLLLQAGMNPNVVNAEGSSPLLFLSKKESKNSIMWPYSISANYQRRFEEFTNTVRMFFREQSPSVSRPTELKRSAIDGALQWPAKPIYWITPSAKPNLEQSAQSCLFSCGCCSKLERRI